MNATQTNVVEMGQELLGFILPEEGANLGLDKLIELAHQMEELITEHLDVLAEPYEPMLTRLASYAAKRVGPADLASKLFFCLVAHFNAATASDQSEFWELEMRTF